MTVADELAIRNLLASIAHLTDSGAVEDYLACLAVDAVWSMPDNPHIGVAASERRGHDEIGAGVRERRGRGLQGPGTGTIHVITTTVVRFAGDGQSAGDTATAESYWMYYASTTTDPALRSCGRYHDTLRREPDGWKLARRRVVLV